MNFDELNNELIKKDFELEVFRKKIENFDEKNLLIKDEIDQNRNFFELHLMKMKKQSDEEIKTKNEQILIKIDYIQKLEKKIKVSYFFKFFNNNK